MKRYMLFFGNDYYPRGGCDDLVDLYDNWEDAVQKAMEPTWDWCHIYDLKERKIAKEWFKSRM